MAFLSSRVQIVFLWEGDLCASKCRLCLTPLVCVSWNGKAFWVDSWTLKVESGLVLFLWWALSYSTKVRGGKALLTDVATSIVCLFVFWPEIARGKLVACFDDGMMVYCFFVVFSAFVHGRVDIWRQLQLFYVPWRMIRQYLEIGPNFFVLGAGKTTNSHIHGFPSGLFSMLRKVFFVCPPTLTLGLWNGGRLGLCV